MANNTYFHIVYDGPALESNEMDVKDLAPSLLALSDAIEEANNILNSGRAKIIVNVKASFKTGCFGVDLHVLQDLGDKILSLFKNENIIAAAILLDYLGFTAGGVVGLVKTIKWVAGRKISKIQIKEDQKAEIHIDDEKLETELHVIELLKSYKLRKSLYEAISRPLEKDGIDSVSTVDKIENEDNFVSINKDEKDFFIVPEQEPEIIEEKEYETNLQLVSVVFQEKNKWRFTEGDSSFYADVNDNEFVDSVQKSEIAFSKGDILTVRLKKKQTLHDETLKSEYEILKVLKHRKAYQQIKLPFDTSSE